MWYHRLKQAEVTLTPYTMYTLCIGFFYIVLTSSIHVVPQAKASRSYTNTIHNVYTMHWVLLLTTSIHVVPQAKASWKLQLTPYTMYTLCIGFLHVPLPYMWYHRLKQAEVTLTPLHNVYTMHWVLLLT